MRIFKISVITFLSITSLYSGVATIEASLPHIADTTDGGSSVSVSGEWAAIGAYNSADASSCYVSMYRFNYDPNTWAWEYHSQVPSNTRQCNGNKGFGYSVSLSGTRLAVGLKDYGNDNRGAYTTYQFDGTEWLEKNKQVLASSSTANDNQANSGFGNTISIRGDYLVVGAPYYDSASGTDVGKAYVYDWNVVKVGSGGNAYYPSLRTKVGAQNNENLGYSVMSYGTKFLVGAPGHDANSIIDRGLILLFDMNQPAASDVELNKLGMYAGGRLGTNISMDNDNILASGGVSTAAGVTQSYVKKDGIWKDGIHIANTHIADVSVNEGVSAVGHQGSKVDNYLDLSGSATVSASKYYATVNPSVVNTSETAQDISLYKNMLMVKHSSTQPAYIYRMPCGFGTELIENTWQMIGVPCEITGGTTVGEVFNQSTSSATYDDLGDYGVNWWVYKQNSNYGETSKSYVLLDESSPVIQGEGYWIYVDHNVTTRVDSTISSTATPVISSPIIIDGVGAGSILNTDNGTTISDANATGKGYVKVLLSNTLPRSIHWGNVLVQYTNTETGITDGIVRMNDTVTLPTILKSGIAYVYDSTQVGQPYRAISSAPGLGDIIKPGEGFWVNALAPNTNISLIVPYEK